MVLKRLLLVALVSGCLPAERERVDVPLRIRLAAEPPYIVGDVTVDVRRAAFTVADVLLSDARGGVVGAWSDARVVELLGGPEALAPAQVYEGDVAGGDFRLRGDPALDLRGVIVTGAGGLVPFDLAPRLDLRAPLAADVSAVIADDVVGFDWVLDLSIVFGPVDPSAPRAPDAALQATGPTLDQLERGLLTPGAWSLVDTP